MISVYLCITQEHDLRLVVLAAIVCLLACYTAFGLAGRARRVPASWLARTWLAAAAVVTGAGVWATHFVAMLAYSPGVPVGYDAGLTILSIAVAILISGVGYYVVLVGDRPVLGGVVIGLAIGTMHYVGMSALQTPATMRWDGAYVVASLLIACSGAALAFHLGMRRGRIGQHCYGPLVLVLAIVGLHFRR